MQRVMLAVVLALAPLPAAAAGDPAAGQAIVEGSCTGCHAKAGSATVSDAAPSFSAIARHHRENRDWVRAWLTGPHPAMPGIDLSRRQIDDVVAYLNTIPAN